MWDGMGCGEGGGWKVVMECCLSPREGGLKNN